ncbi:hypothetical protein MXD61_11500 [Frankia sp. AgPm24]|nr:hypothetical protein [Frankia sp. AgPm24]
MPDPQFSVREFVAVTSKAYPVLTLEADQWHEVGCFFDPIESIYAYYSIDRKDPQEYVERFASAEALLAARGADERAVSMAPRGRGRQSNGLPGERGCVADPNVRGGRAFGAGSQRPAWPETLGGRARVAAERRSSPGSTAVPSSSAMMTFTTASPLVGKGVAL